MAQNTLKKQSSIDDKKPSTLTHQESTTSIASTSASATKPSKSNSNGSSWSVTKKKHQQMSGQVYRSQSGSTLYQQQHDSNSRLPVVKSCSGECDHVTIT